MSCYHPLKAFVVGKTDTGKRELSIQPYTTDFVVKVNGFWRPRCGSPPLNEITRSEFVTIPCGQCMGCRIDYSRQWANRMMLELGYHKDAWFVTLTYDNAHLPLTVSKPDENGEVVELGTLCKRDFQLFMKRLRKATGQDLRYYCSGEYGSTTARPHFHAIIYGLHLPDDDLSDSGKSMDGFRYYRSKIVETAWSARARGHENDKSFPISLIGMVCVAPVSWETCAYTARYVAKKVNGKLAEVYDRNNLVPEFSLMSRRPGIAYQYYLDHKKEIYDGDVIFLRTPQGGRKIKPPRYYDMKFDIECPDEMDQIHAQRQKVAEDLLAAKLASSDKSYLELLADEEASFKKKFDILKKGRNVV